MKYLLLTLFIFFMMCGFSSSEIIFQDNFDSQEDWSIAQGTAINNGVCPSGNLPSDKSCSESNSKYYAYFDTPTYLANNQYDSLSISSFNARGGLGKALINWNEVPVTSSGFEASDGSIYISLTDSPSDYGHSEIWVSFYRKFDPNFWDGEYQHKYFHVSHFKGGNIFNWHGSDSHGPFAVGGMANWGESDSYGYKRKIHYSLIIVEPESERASYRWEESDMDCGVFNHSQSNHNIFSKAIMSNGSVDGGWKNPGNFGDGSYYLHEYQFKMNSLPGAEDGVIALYINGQCQYKFSNIPWVKAGGTMVGWNLVVLGGNNNYRNPAGEFETFYATDDLTISTSRLDQGPPLPTPSIINVTIE